MHSFYFNECLPEITTNIGLEELLVSCVKEFNQLVKSEIGIEKGIILEKETEKTQIGHRTLKEIITSIPDQQREIRNLAYSYFTKYPIQQYLKSSKEEDDILEQDYKFEGIDAINLAIAWYNKCVLFSIPIHKSIKSDLLKIEGTSTNISLHNLYGVSSNTAFIEEQIRNFNDASLDRFDQLLHCLDNTIFTKTFEKKFKGERIDVQESIINYFRKAKKRNLETPFFPDNDLIKNVTPDSNNIKTKVFELRVRNPIELRVYFFEYQNTVYIADLGYKADYKEESSSAQNKDIKRALNSIDYLIKLKK